MRYKVLFQNMDDPLDRETYWRTFKSVAEAQELLLEPFGYKPVYSSESGLEFEAHAYGENWRATLIPKE